MNFTFNGVNSQSFGLKVVNSNHLSSPAKRIESVEVEGRTGNLIIDDGSRSNLSIVLECLVQHDSSALLHLSNNLSNWLQTPIGYKVLSFSDGKTFNAVCTNQIDLNRIAMNFTKIQIKFDAVEVLS